MKKNYNKLKKKIDAIMVQSLFKSGGTKNEKEASAEAYLITTPSKFKNGGYELAFLNKEVNEKSYTTIAAFINNNGEFIFSYGFNTYGKMIFQHKSTREEEKTILLINHIITFCTSKIFIFRILQHIKYFESDKVKNHFLHLLNE